MTIKEALSFAMSELKHIEYPYIESNVLLCHTLGVDRIYLMINDQEIITLQKEEQFKTKVALRKSYMPMAYIIGYREFYGRDFICRPEVLIPRTDTETLIEEVIRLMGNENLKGLEIGVGTSIISTTLLCENKMLNMTAVDISDYAIDLAKENSQKHEVEDRLTLIKSDIFKNLGEETYDFIVSNPPYIETKEIKDLMPDVKNYEPHLALDGDEDGLYFYREIAKGGLSKIKPKGFVAFEIGYNQGQSVPQILENEGYIDIRVIKDLQGNHRVVTAIVP